jgi:hypothetical protein
MADGDIFRKLKQIYRKSYKWLCEGKASTDECAGTLMKALKKDIQAKGDLPISVAKKIGETLTKIFEESCGNIDFGLANKEIEKILHIDEWHDRKELMLRAVKSYIQEIRYGSVQNINASIISESIIGNYFNEVYESSFKEGIPLIDKHHMGIDSVTLEERIKKLQPDVMSTILLWAKKAVINNSVAKLRIPKRRLVSPIDMDENLC